MTIISLASAGWGTTAVHTKLRALAMFQTQEVVPVGNGHLVTIFIGIAALALLAQALVMVGIAVAGLKLKKDLTAEVAEIKAKLMPVVDKTHSLVSEVAVVANDLAPRVKAITVKVEGISAQVETISGHAAEISALVKEKVGEFAPRVSEAGVVFHTANQTLMDATMKTHEQIQRVNAMITESLDATQKLGKSIRHTVTQPGRELSGIASGVKAAVTKFFDTNGGAPKGPPPPEAEPYRPYVTTPYSAASERKRDEDISL